MKNSFTQLTNPLTSSPSSDILLTEYFPPLWQHEKTYPCLQSPQPIAMPDTLLSLIKKKIPVGIALHSTKYFPNFLIPRLAYNSHRKPALLIVLV